MGRKLISPSQQQPSTASAGSPSKPAVGKSRKSAARRGGSWVLISAVVVAVALAITIWWSRSGAGSSLSPSSPASSIAQTQLNTEFGVTSDSPSSDDDGSARSYEFDESTLNDVVRGWIAKRPDTRRDRPAGGQARPRPDWLPANPIASCPDGPKPAHQQRFKRAVLNGDFDEAVRLLRSAPNCALQLLQLRDAAAPHHGAVHWALNARHAQTDNRTTHELVGQHERIIELLVTTPGAVDHSHLCPLYFAVTCRNSIAVSLLLRYAPPIETAQCLEWFRDWNNESILHTAARLKGSGFARFWLQPPKHLSVLELNDFHRPTNCTRDSVIGGSGSGSDQRRRRCTAIGFQTVVESTGVRDLRHLLEFSLSPTTTPASQLTDGVEWDVNPNHQNRIGDTPLHVAAAAGRTTVVYELLLAPRIDSSVSNQYGLTALHVAASYGWVEITRLLVAHNTSVCGAVDRMTRTALDIARFQRNEDVRSVLRQLCPRPLATAALTPLPTPPPPPTHTDDGGWGTAAGADNTSASDSTAVLPSADDLTRCDIDIVNGDTLTPFDLVMRYVSLARPVLIRYSNPAKTLGPIWSAFQKWRRPAFLKSYGATEFPVTAIPFFYAKEFDTDTTTATAGSGANSTESAAASSTTPDGPTKLKLSEFVNRYMSGNVSVSSNNNSSGSSSSGSGGGEPIPYIFSSYDIPKSLWRDIDLPPPLSVLPQPLITATKGASTNAKGGGNDAAGGGYNIPIEVRQFGIGPAGSGSPPHFHLPAFNMLVFGEKRWWMWPPNRGAYFSTRHIRRELDQMRADRHALVCTQHAGDIMFVPQHYGHAVYNTRPSLCAAFEMFS